MSALAVASDGVWAASLGVELRGTGFEADATLGEVSDALREVFGDAWPAHVEAEAPGLRVPTDFVGVNYYSVYQVSAGTATQAS